MYTRREETVQEKVYRYAWVLPKIYIIYILYVLYAAGLVCQNRLNAYSRTDSACGRRIAKSTEQS